MKSIKVRIKKRKKELFKIAFAELIGFCEYKKIHKRLQQLVSFVNIKMKLFKSHDMSILREDLSNWIDSTIDSPYSFFIKPLFNSIFISLSKNEYHENKKNNRLLFIS